MIIGKNELHNLLRLGGLDAFVYEVNDHCKHNQDDEFHGDKTALIELTLLHCPYYRVFLGVCEV